MKLLLNEIKQQWLSFDSKLQQQHPVSIMEQYSQRFDLVLQRIKSIPKEYISRISNKINTLNIRLFRSTPLPLSQEMKSETGNLHGRLISSMQEIHKNTEQLLFVSMAKLDGISPLNTLGRGYAYVLELKTKKHISSIEQIKTGLDTRTRLKDGTFDAKISRVDPLKPMDEK
jgi:exodeoxyribonuclease VII large subunit